MVHTSPAPAARTAAPGANRMVAVDAVHTAVALTAVVRVAEIPTAGVRRDAKAMAGVADTLPAPVADIPATVATAGIAATAAPAASVSAR